MNLPQLKNETNFIKIQLPSGKKIGVRGWKVKDEKELLFSLDSEVNEADNKVNNIIAFLKNCSDNEKVFDSLSEQDLKKVAIEVRKLSKGDRIEYNYTCPHCNHQMFDEVKLREAEVVKPFNNAPIKVNEEISFIVKDLSFKDADKIFEKYKESPNKYTYYFILNSIEAVVHNGTVYKDFTLEEIDTWIGDLSSDDLKILFEEFEKNTSEVKLERKIKCIKCKEEIEISYGDLFSFLVF